MHHAMMISRPAPVPLEGGGGASKSNEKRTGQGFANPRPFLPKSTAAIDMLPCYCSLGVGVISTTNTKHNQPHTTKTRRSRVRRQGVHAELGHDAEMVREPRVAHKGHLQAAATVEEAVLLP
jgi:hypothetical protein